MEAVRGGSRKPYQRSSARPKFVAEEEVPRRVVPDSADDEIELPATIKIRSQAALRAIVPGTVWRQGAFKWDPQSFVAESERLRDDRVIDSRVQNNSLKAFLNDPQVPVIYGVSGNPDDAKAKLFAAFLAAAHIERVGARANVVWHCLYGSYDNPLLREYDPIDGKSSPTLLVLSNLTAGSTNVKLEKARDLIERFAEIPRIIVSAGEDPISFHSTRLYTEVNALAYFANTLIKPRVEII